jgi:hypothetical protein
MSRKGMTVPFMTSALAAFWHFAGRHPDLAQAWRWYSVRSVDSASVSSPAD